MGVLMNKVEGRFGHGRGSRGTMGKMRGEAAGKAPVDISKDGVKGYNIWPCKGPDVIVKLP